jgi:thiosulfate reductase/polysulfide reductase chain A
VVTREPGPLTIEEGIEPTFATPSGKIELWSGQLADAGLDPIPDYVPPEGPAPGEFRLLFGRSPVHTFGRTTNNRFLSEICSDNEIWVNEGRARELGVVGEMVILVNQDGVRSEPVRVRATRRIRTDCVYMVHGYGHDAKGLGFARKRGASDSKLVTRTRVDPIMGGTGMNVNFVRIERTGEVPA